MAEHGAKVVVSSRKADACEAVAAGIRGEGRRGDRWLPANIGRKEQLQQLVGRHGRAVGRDRHPGLQRGREPLFRPGDRLSGRGVRPDHGIERQIATSGCPTWCCRKWRTRGGRGGHRDILDRRAPRHADHRGLRDHPRRPTRRWCATSRWSGGAKNIRANCIAPGLVKTDFARALVGETRPVLSQAGEGQPPAADRRAGRDCRGRDLPGEPGGQLHHGPDLRHRWRGHHRRCGVE